MSDRPLSQLEALQQENQELKQQLERQAQQIAGFDALAGLADFSAIHQLFADLPYFVCVLDYDLSLLYVNRLLPGMSFAEIQGKKVHEVVPESAYQTIQDSYHRAIESKKPVEYIVQQPTPTGEVYDISTSLQPMLDENGNIIRWLTIAHDITDERLYQNNLAKAQQRYLALNENVPIAIIECATDGKVLQWNRGAEQIFGYLKYEVQNKPLLDFSPEGPSDKVKAAYLRIIKGDKNVQFENSCFRKSGEPVHCRWYITAIADSNGNIESFLNIGQDITQQVDTRNRLNEAKIKAEKLTEAKSNFIASVSHELRTPMHGILNAADLLSEQSLNANASELVKLIHDSSKSLLHVIDDVLDFSRLEVGKLKLNLQAIDLNSIINSVIQLLQGNALKRGNQLHFSSDSDKLFIESDAGRLRQILYNLIGNAVKFTENGDIHVRLTHQLNSDGSNAIRIAVTDSGIGIAKDRHEEIFDSFSQADESINSRFGGSGLGLAISQRIAKLLGGSISVASEPGKGATFSLDFNANLLEAGENPTNTATIARQYRGHVLIVDDNPVNINICTKLLEKLGLSVSAANNGQQAVELSGSNHYDCILMDIQMPVMDGYSAASAIRALGENFAQLPIIAMSANSVGDNQDYYKARGIDDYIIKPFNQNSLITLLDQYLNIEV